MILVKKIYVSYYGAYDYHTGCPMKGYKLQDQVEHVIYIVVFDRKLIICRVSGISI